MSAAALPRRAPGQEFRGRGLKAGRNFRARVLISIWPKGALLRSRAIAMTPILECHIVDPVPVSLGQPFCVAGRLASSRSASRMIEMARRIWTMYHRAQCKT
eukprot:196438-Pyramimonas_sp.AAC.1